LVVLVQEVLEQQILVGVVVEAVDQAEHQ